MAIKIIRHGELPEEKIYSGTCHHCNTEVELTKMDGEYVSDQRDGSFIRYECPLCKRTAYAYL